MPDPVKIVVNAATPEKIVVNQGPITIQSGSNYTLPAANATTLGGIIVGDNLTVTANGVLSGVNSYTLPAATNSTLGGVIVGDGLSVQADGSISVGNYVKNNSQYGNLTVTDSVAFSGGLQCELSAPSFGEKIIHYALNGGARTDWLANTATAGSYYGASVAGSAGGAVFQKTTFSTYPSNATYTQLLLTDTDATLTLGKLGSDLAKTKVWTTNSILTQGYADTRYLPAFDKTGTPVDTFNTVFGFGTGDAANVTTIGDLVYNPDPSTYFRFTGSYLVHNNNAQVIECGTKQNTAADVPFVSAKVWDYSGTNGEFGFEARTNVVSMRYSDGTNSSSLEMTSGGTTVSGPFVFQAQTKDVTIVKSTSPSPVWSDDSVLTRSYADSRYLPTANFTYANLTGTPTLATVATSGSYNDLSNLPTLFDGSYTSLTNVPATFAPSAHTHTVSQITDFPAFATVATSGLYSDLTGTPDLTGYLTTAAASSTYLTISTAASTYQTVSGMSSYLTTATAASTYATISSLSSYLTTATAASTYQPIGSYATTGANTFSGTQAYGGNLATQPKLQAYRETVTTPAISSGTLTLDLSGSNNFNVSLNANITTLTISNVPATGTGAVFALRFTADGTARSVTWPNSITWVAGTAPTLTSTNNKRDTFIFESFDGGTTWAGYVGGQGY